MRYLEILEATVRDFQTAWWMEPSGKFYDIGDNDHDDIINDLLPTSNNPAWAQKLNDPYREALARGWLQGRFSISSNKKRQLSLDGNKESISKLLPKLLKLAKQYEIDSIGFQAFPAKVWIDIVERSKDASEAWGLAGKYIKDDDWVNVELIETGYIVKLKNWLSIEDEDTTNYKKDVK